MARPINWLLSVLPLLKLSGMVCCLLIIVFFLDGRDQWLPYKIIFVTAFAFLFGIFISLIVHYFDISRTNKQLPWLSLEILFDVFGFLFCAGAVAVLCYDWYLLNAKNNRHHRIGPPMTIGYDGWQRRVMVVILVLCCTAVLFLATLGRVKRAGLA